MKIPLLDHTGAETRKQLKKMLIDSRHEDRYFQSNFDIKKNQNDLDFPSVFRIQNDSSKDTVYELRNRLRVNQFDHEQFDPKFTSIDARKYYTGIYERNKRIKDEDLVKTIGQYSRDKGSYKVGAIKIFELFEEIYANKPKREKKPDERKLIRQRLNREYPRMTKEMFVELMYEIKKQNRDKPLDMLQEDRVLRFVDQKMKDISPQNIDNLKVKLRILNELEEEGYQLQFLSQKQLKKKQALEKLAQTQETKKSESATIVDLESIQEMKEAPNIDTMPDEINETAPNGDILQSNKELEVARSSQHQSNRSVESKGLGSSNSERGDLTKPYSVQPDEKAALKHLKEESVNQSSKILKSTVQDTNYNQMQKQNSMTAFDDNEVQDYGRSKAQLDLSNRQSDKNLIRQDQSQMQLVQPKVQNLQTFENIPNTHIQSQVFNQQNIFLSQKTLNVATDQNQVSNNKIENGSYGTVEVNESQTYKSPVESSGRTLQEFDGLRSQEFRNRFQTVQNQDSFLDALDSRIDNGELPRIDNRQENFDTLTFDIESPEIHSAIPDKFENFKEEPNSFLPLIDSARNRQFDQHSFFPEIRDRKEQNLSLQADRKPFRNRNNKIHQSLDFARRLKTQLNLNHPPYQVLKEPKKQTNFSPGFLNAPMPYERQMNEHNQRKLLSQSELGPLSGENSKQPLTMRFQEQRRQAPVINSQTQRQRAKVTNQLSQSVDFEGQQLAQIQFKFQTEQKNTQRGADLTRQSLSILQKQGPRFKISLPKNKFDQSLKKLSQSPTIRECRYRMQNETPVKKSNQKSKKRASLVNIIHNCGDPAKIERASQKIHDKIDLTMGEMQEEMNNLKTIYQQYKDQFDKKDDVQLPTELQGKNLQFLQERLKDYKEIEEDYWWNRNVDYELFLSPNAVELVKEAQIDPEENNKKKQKVWQPNKMTVTKGISKIMGNRI